MFAMASCAGDTRQSGVGLTSKNTYKEEGSPSDPIGVITGVGVDDEIIWADGPEIDGTCRNRPGIGIVANQL